MKFTISPPKPPEPPPPETITIVLDAKEAKDLYKILDSHQSLGNTSNGAWQVWSNLDGLFGGKS